VWTFPGTEVSKQSPNFQLKKVNFQCHGLSQGCVWLGRLPHNMSPLGQVGLVKFTYCCICTVCWSVMQTVYRQCVSDQHHGLTTVATETPHNVTPSAPSANTTNVSPSSPGVTEKISLWTPASANVTNDVCTRPQSYVSETTLAGLWHIVYWTCQALTWSVYDWKYFWAICIFCWLILCTIRLDCNATVGCEIKMVHKLLYVSLWFVCMCKICM